MKQFFAAALLTIAFNASSQDHKLKLDSSKPVLTVETSCGECQFKLKGKSCDLAVRIEGKAYFVDGTKIDDHGDAHAKEGFCNAVRKAKVQGEIKNERFVATYFKLLPETKKN
jgi:hypothetical protein